VLYQNLLWTLLFLFSNHFFVRMRCLSFFCVWAALLLSALASSNGDTPESEPEVIVTASFPETNTFGHVVNGEKNSLTLSVENKSDRNVTLVSVAGSVHDPETNRVVKNLTAMQYSTPLIQGVKVQLPFTFYSEFKPGDLRLDVWLEHSFDNIKYRVTAYDSIVTVVEPEGSIFDFKLVTTYLMVTAVLGGLLYIAYLSFMPKKSRSKRTAPSTVSTPVTSATATGAGGYQEEWIPEHHLRKPKSGKKASGFASGTSGDEHTAETSGTEGRKRKGKK